MSQIIKVEFSSSQTNVGKVILKECSGSDAECVFRPHPDTDFGNIRTAFRNYPDRITAHPDTLSS